MNYEKMWEELKTFLDEKIEAYSNYKGTILRDASVQCEVQCRAIKRKMEELEDSK